MIYQVGPVDGQAFDAAPFASALPEGAGLLWADPREVHRVVARFPGGVPEGIELQYWQTQWPHLRLPKDHLEGRGSAGWWQLGDWFNGRWQTADADVLIEGEQATFTFRPLCDKEFPDLPDFPATHRTTMKLRLAGADAPSAALAAYTDSVWEQATVTALWAGAAPADAAFEAYNGAIIESRREGRDRYVVTLWATANSDPYSFDKTLLTIRGESTATVALEDLAAGPVCAPDFRLAVVAGRETGDYAALRAATAISALPAVYETVAELPAQSWQRAWDNMVPKRGSLSLPLGPDGSRHKFGLQPDGALTYRTNNEVLLKCRGADSDRLAADAANLRLTPGIGGPGGERSLLEGTLPIGTTVWSSAGGVVQTQEAFATVLGGADPQREVAPDACAVCLLRHTVSTPASASDGSMVHSYTCTSGEEREALTVDETGAVRAGDKLRLLIDTQGRGALISDDSGVRYEVTVPPGQSHTIIVKVPYLWLTPEETEALQALDFDREREAVAEYWRRRLQPAGKLRTGVPELDDFHTAVPVHSLINSEFDPASEPDAAGRRRFARAGSFNYLVFGNESCMMIADLDRRGLHTQARECLEAFLQYQGTAPLPGDFRSQAGVLWATAGHEHIGYNQHHGWILWCLVEHYRLTRDEDWLRSVSGKVLAAAEWIIRERERPLPPDHPEAGLLPAGNLEDITDWWPWLSTDAYTWRGLDAAAEALERLAHEAAARVRAAADDYRRAILSRFRAAAERSPLVRLRNGSYVPHFPSHVYRRGRSFGWICETLEGAIHLLITGLIEPHSREARWIIDDYEDNLYLSEQYGYFIEDFGRHWFDWGGFSMQACLLLNVEPYLYRDDAKHALRATFNALSANFYPHLRMAAEHALPELGDWRGDHYKSPDEANACNWLRMLFVREQGEELLVGQAVPEDWLRSPQGCGVERVVTHFGEVSVSYRYSGGVVTARLAGPRRNPPARIKLRLWPPYAGTVEGVRVNGAEWQAREGDWIVLPGDVGEVEVTGRVV